LICRSDVVCPGSRRAEFNYLLENVRDEAARDIIEFLHNSGWRSAEPKAFVWSWITENMVRLPAEHSKSKKVGLCRSPEH
jgi:hypothetical protein